MVTLSMKSPTIRHRCTCSHILKAFRMVSTKSDETIVQIGSVIGKRSKQLDPDSPFAPQKQDFLDFSTPSILHHLQWMLQKDSLKQDMMLIGPPGAGAVFRRRLALAFCEMLQRETQLLTLTQDTTESDLKQRRELIRQEGDTGALDLNFVDQSPVAAAIHGRFLILDGLEKAERNVMPTLNNLLEHREMNLEDGRFLVSPERFKEISATSAQHGTLVPTHPDFRVIALCVPNPPYSSLARSIDPPLRSRFQIRRVDPLPSSELLTTFMPHKSGKHYHDMKTVSKLATLVGSMDAASSRDIQVRPFPSHALKGLNPFLDDIDFLKLSHIYPVVHSEWGNEASRKALKAAFQETFTPRFSEKEQNRIIVKSIERTTTSNERLANVTVQRDQNMDLDNDSIISVPCGSAELYSSMEQLGDKPFMNYIVTKNEEEVFATMLEHHQSRDLLLFGPSGEGKSAAANHFARRLGYQVHLVHLFPEMTALDLLLRRSTCPMTGETTWEESTLVKAAKAGELCILDGIEKLRPHVLGSLQSLCVDRDLFLPDGRRLIQLDRNTEDLRSTNLIPIHPSFRVIALASPPEDNIHKKTTVLDEAMDMFTTIFMNSSNDEASIRSILSVSRNPNCPEKIIDQLLRLRKRLTTKVADDCGVSPLSTRNLIRTVRRTQSEDDLSKVLLESIFVADLIPLSQRTSLERIMNDCEIYSDSPLTTQHQQQSSTKSYGSYDASELLCVRVSQESCTIGTFTMPRKKASRPEMVPSPKFFDIPYHIKIIKDLLTDWNNGERAFLLLGNQGVGKNMVLDRLCQLANFEREYIQLHRDSTVGQITLQPTLVGGRIIWQDSPLVRAARDGLTLVVDEADKAPAEVLSVLKGLVEDGELLLADGRRISRHQDESSLDNVIPMHPDFTIWVLANRPGYPFLGNSFFRQIGDCFSTRVISNPNVESEISLLGKYGPNVDPTLVRQIASSFAELRLLSDAGDLLYPYSTREAVSVVKHLEKFPEDGVVAALHNVLDFDSYEDTVYSNLAKTFQRHNIPVETYARWKESMERNKESLKIEILGQTSSEGVSSNPPPLGSPKRGKWDENNEAHVGGNQWAGGTGGSDTAGLGGRGGPYRLDRGHKVHQISDAEKAKVGEETKRAAQAIAQKALRDKLNEIDMSPKEWDMYKKFVDPIQPEVIKLRSILNQIEMNQKERGWIKQQSHGELDDTKIVDSVVGEKYIYKRRGILEQSGPSLKPKRLRFVMDCSASMYRFNGYDERLTRELEVANLIMESFDGMEHRYEYSIVAHSGDSPVIPLVEFGIPPTNEKERMKILQKMVAHTQYCQSGDHTVSALGRAIHDVTVGTTESDNALVIALSDANFERYGIDPRSIAKIMQAGDSKNVKSHCIFLASFGPEVEEIKQELPPGRGHVCMSTQDLPKIVREILTPVG